MTNAVRHADWPQNPPHRRLHARKLCAVRRYPSRSAGRQVARQAHPAGILRETASTVGTPQLGTCHALRCPAGRTPCIPAAGRYSHHTPTLLSYPVLQTRGGGISCRLALGSIHPHCYHLTFVNSGWPCVARMWSSMANASTGQYLDDASSLAPTGSAWISSRCIWLMTKLEEASSR